MGNPRTLSRSSYWAAGSWIPGPDQKCGWADRQGILRYELCNLPYIHTIEQNESVECYDWKGLNRISYCSGHEIEPRIPVESRLLWKFEVFYEFQNIQRGQGDPQNVKGITSFVSKAPDRVITRVFNGLNLTPSEQSFMSVHESSWKVHSRNCSFQKFELKILKFL